jgi:hypothetical protein
MQSKTAEKIYIDSNVWFSFLLKGQFESNNSIEYDEAGSLFDKIASNENSIILITNLVVLEITNVIRKKTIANTKFDEDMDPKIKEGIMREIQELTSNFINLIKK